MKSPFGNKPGLIDRKESIMIFFRSKVHTAKIASFDVKWRKLTPNVSKNLKSRHKCNDI